MFAAYHIWIKCFHAKWYIVIRYDLSVTSYLNPKESDTYIQIAISFLLKVEGNWKVPVYWMENNTSSPSIRYRWPVTCITFYLQLGSVQILLEWTWNGSAISTRDHLSKSHGWIRSFISRFWIFYFQCKKWNRSVTLIPKYGILHEMHGY